MQLLEDAPVAVGIVKHEVDRCVIRGRGEYLAPIRSLLLGKQRTHLLHRMPCERLDVL